MTASRTPDRLIHDFLLEGEEELHDRVYDAIRDAIEQKRQRAFLGPWRISTMNRFLTLGAAAVALLVVVIIGAQLFGSPANLGGGGDATPTPQPTTTLEPTAEATSNPEADLPEGPFEFADMGIRMTVAIPAPGWTFGEPTFFYKGVEVDNLPEAGILFWAFPGSMRELFVYEDPCRATSTKPDTPVTTVDEIATALAAQASRNASETADVTVGGYEGKRLTLHTPDDAVLGECERGQFVMYGTEDDPAGRYNQGPGQIDELWILDVDGTVVIIDAVSRPDSRAELLEEMRTIIESTTFEAP
jgi:hypothetical protein